MLLLGTVATGALTVEDKLQPGSKTRFALEASSGAEARWNSFVQVYRGTFSPQLTGSDGDTGKINIGPLNLPLSGLSESGITFWAYFETNDGSVPRVDFVLDNGRRMEGYRNTSPVTGTKAEIVDEADLGYTAVSLWTQMKVQDCPFAGSECGFYSSNAGVDPLLPASFGISTPKNLAEWSAQFPGARIVQMRIAYGDDAPAVPGVDDTIYIDSLKMRGRTYDLEPTVASTGNP